MTKTNNVTRLLESKKIPYQAFDLPEEKLGAVETAAILNIPPEIVYKTIVITREKPGKPLLVVIAGTCEVNLKKVASFLNEKKVHLPTQREAEQLTHLQAGGISPLALINKGFTVLLDQSAKELELIHISGGQRGLNIQLPVKALVELTQARFADLSSPSSLPMDQDG